MFEVTYQWLKLHLSREEGQTMAEYGLILALIAVIVAVSLTAVQGSLTGVFNGIAKQL